LAMGWMILLVGVSLHASAAADGFNGAVMARLQGQKLCSERTGLAVTSLYEPAPQLGCAEELCVTSWLVLAGGCWLPAGAGDVFDGGVCGCEPFVGGGCELPCAAGGG
jgi:hypothetical protein